MFENNNQILQELILKGKYIKIFLFATKKIKNEYDANKYFYYIKQGDLIGTFCCLYWHKVDYKTIDKNSEVNNTGFLYACFYGHENIVKLFLEYFPDCVNYQNLIYRNGFIFACLALNTNVVKLLLEKKVDINCVDNMGRRGYDYLEDEEKAEIRKFIDDKKLYIDKP